MPTQSFGLCGGTHATRDTLWQASRSFNWYPSVDASGGAQSKIELSPCPGLTRFCTLPDPPIRGLWSGDNRLFAVSANGLYEIFADGTFTWAGNILNAQTPVQFAADGNSLLVATGDQVWRTPFTGGAPVKVIDGAVSVAFLDGYYIALLSDLQTIGISTDGAVWDPGERAQSSGPQDRKQRLAEHEGNLWVFGTETVMPWYNSGDPDFPFAPVKGAVVNQGTLAAFSPCRVDGTMFWLGQDKHGYGRVYRSQGYTPVAVSNPGIEHLIKQYLDLGTDPLITGSAYQENGHTFYLLSFPKAKACLVYDLNTDMWHERARWNGTTWEQWRGSSFHAFAFGKHLVARILAPPFPSGDEDIIFEASTGTFLDDGNQIRRYRAAPYTQASQQWLFHSEVRLLTKGTSPVSMRYLKDDNLTWSNTRTVVPWLNEVEYRRLGRARSRMYEFWCMDGGTGGAQYILDGQLKASPGLERS